MINWKVWLLFISTDAVISMIPGPAVLYVLSQALRGGPHSAIWASSGILSANILYFALSASSVGALIAASYRLFFLIKWAGAMYLVYLGLVTFFAKDSPVSLPQSTRAPRSGRHILREGFFVQAANPKAILFFTAILPQFLDLRREVAMQILLLGVSSILVEFAILFIYGQLAARALRTARNPRFDKLTKGAAACLLIGAGLGLARLNRS